MMDEVPVGAKWKLGGLTRGRGMIVVVQFFLVALLSLWTRSRISGARTIGFRYGDDGDAPAWSDDGGGS